MKAHQISDTNSLLHILRSSEVFDQFELVELALSTYAAYHIDGHLLTDDAPTDHYIKYSQIRPTFFHITKDDAPIRTFKLVLFHRAADQEVISGGFVNILRQGEVFMLTSAVSYRTFTTDKSYEDAWDAYIAKLLATHSLI